MIPAIMANTRVDVIAAIQAAFPGRDTATILSVLDLYGAESHEREREPVQLAIVALSEGSADKLLNFVQIAKAGYRDILLWAASGPLSEEEGAEQRRAALRLLERGNKK